MSQEGKVSHWVRITRPLGVDLMLLRKATATGQRGLDWHRPALDTGGCCGDTQWRMRSCRRARRLLAASALPKRLVLPSPNRNEESLTRCQEATRCWMWTHLRTKCTSMKWPEKFSAPSSWKFFCGWEKAATNSPSLSSSKLMNTLETDKFQ